MKKGLLMVFTGEGKGKPQGGGGHGLNEAHLQPMTGAAQGKPQGGSGFALALAGKNHQQSFCHLIFSTPCFPVYATSWRGFHADSDNQKVSNEMLF